MRDDSVAVAKGIAIILMVMAHARCPLWWQHYISMFHMPLFFFMSGYCFKNTYLNDWQGFVKKRMKGVYWPFVKWSVIFLMLHNIFFFMNIYNDSYGFHGKVSELYSLHDYVQRLKMIFVSMSGNEQLLGGYWFLKSLFFGSIIFYAIRKIISSLLWGGGVLLLLSTILCYFNWIIPVFQLNDTDFLSSFFIMCGYLFKSYSLKIPTQWKWIVMCAVIVVVGTYYFHTTMLAFDITNIFPYVVCSILGTMMLFGISKHIALKKRRGTAILLYVGNYTFNILTWHLLSFKVLSLVIICVYGLSSKRLAEFPVIEEYAHQGWWVLYMMVGVALPLIRTCYYHKIRNTQMPT